MPTLSYNQRYYAKNRVNILKKRRERYNQAVGITDAEPYEPHHQEYKSLLQRRRRRGRRRIRPSIIPRTEKQF